MTYAVKEAFLTLQGEGVQSGSRAVFLRFAGCNLWSGRERDRAAAQCNFCDTDFVGTDGEGGGKFADAAQLADHVLATWGEGEDRRLVVRSEEHTSELHDALPICGRAIGQPRRIPAVRRLQPLVRQGAGQGGGAV